MIKAMLAAGWTPADPVTLASSVRIAVDTVMRRSDDSAPVSPLLLFGRKQDLAFEQPVPGGPRHRHHVRFWRWSQLRDGSPVWLGAVTYDDRAGLSYIYSTAEPQAARRSGSGSRHSPRQRRAPAA